MDKGIFMTEQAVDRANLFAEISQKKISQTGAAKVLGLSVRQVQRLYAAFLKEGVKALASHRWGKPGNRQLPPFLRARVLELVTCEKYTGFGPTFMCEKLEELHGIKISRETTRKLMIQTGVWEVDKKKRLVIHQQRPPRARFGELLQIDGSPHAWFEDRGESCVLIVFIDDATKRTYGKFFESETTEAYMTVTEEYIKKYGRWEVAYSDKHGIFRVNTPGCTKRESLTQFGRALKELGIRLMCANSPQAKGRVERMNQTLQDRLVKEMRLVGINDIHRANEFLLTFWDPFNEKFSIPPRNPVSAHRPLLPEHRLERILCKKENRKISKNLEIQYNNVIYQITLDKPLGSLRGANVVVMENIKGEIFIEYRGKPLPFRIYDQQEFVGHTVSSKEIDRALKEQVKRTIPNNHPWKQQGISRLRRRIKKEMGII